MENEIRDFYLLHYIFYFNDATQKGEGSCFVDVDLGAGLRQGDIQGALNSVAEGLNLINSKDLVIIPASVSFLCRCERSEFYLKTS